MEVDIGHLSAEVGAMNARQPKGMVYIGGQLVEPAEAQISIFDRGFLYGDSVFETLRVYDGVPFAMEHHLRRLERSGERIGFRLPWEEAELRSVAFRVLEASGLDNAYMRIIATRGAGELGLDPGLAVDPQLIALVLPLPVLPEDLYTVGRRAVLVGVRRNLKVAVDPEAKTGNYINSVMALREARQAGADEAIMLDHGGRVAEGSSANVFAWIDGVWMTPPLDVGILGGITRATILELARAKGIPAREAIVWPDDLARAEEVFLCSSVRELVPIVELNEKAVGEGNVGAETQCLLQLYRDAVRAEVRAGR